MAETEQKRYAKAAFLLQSLTRTERLSALTQYYMGRIYKEQGKPSQAAAAYEKVIKKDSHFVEARPMLARIYESLRRIDDAWRQYFKITLMDPFHKLALEKKQELLTSLTKKPEEIVLPTKIKGFTLIKPAPERLKSPKIRIGIGTSPSRLPVYRQKITFRSAGLFSITDVKTGKALAFGRPDEPWSITVKSATGPVTTDLKAEIISPDNKVVSAFSGSVMLRQKEPGKATVILDEIPYAPGMSWSGVAAGYSSTTANPFTLSFHQIAAA